MYMPFLMRARNHGNAVAVIETNTQAATAAMHACRAVTLGWRRVPNASFSGFLGTGEG